MKRELKPIFEVVANGFIDVPPGATQKVGWDWGPGRVNLGGFLGGSGYPDGKGACVTMLIGHMHKRGTLFTADPSIASDQQHTALPADRVRRSASPRTSTRRRC